MAKARRRGCIFQRGNRWCVTFRVNGRQVWRSFPTKTAAELYQAETQQAIARRAFRVPERVTFAAAVDEWLRHGEHERHLKPSTLRDYRSAVERHLRPAFGTRRLEDVTAQAIERWRAFEMVEGRLPRRTADKLVAMLHGIFERARKAYGFPSNPVDDVERHPQRYDAGRFEFYSPEEVLALVRQGSPELDGPLFLTAAFTGLRMGELLALRWRDVDFEAETIRVLASFDHRAGEAGTPKSGKGRGVPMVPEVAQALARLGQRERFTGDDELVFPGAEGSYLDSSALRRRFLRARKTAGLRELRFHDLRHTFGSLAVRRANIRDVQAWMGHADIETTMRYVHYASRAGEAQLLADAFRVADPASGLQANGVHAAADGFLPVPPAQAESPADAAVSRNATEGADGR